MTQVHQKLRYCLASNCHDSCASRADDCSGCSFGPSGTHIPATGNVLRAPDKRCTSRRNPIMPQENVYLKMIRMALLTVGLILAGLAHPVPGWAQESATRQELLKQQ